jgi:DNA processing protein
VTVADAGIPEHPEQSWAPMDASAHVVRKTYGPVELLGALTDVELRNAPAQLHVTGYPELVQQGRRVAIVGSRDASELGLRRAARLAHALVDQQITVVSGLARGIDTAAHRATIERGGHTIAVLGTPLDQCNPRANEPLQNEIGERHLLISQFAIGQPTQRSHFVLRNRTMALVSHASVIVEAGEGSGSLSQGWEALRLGRPLFLMKSLFENPALKWPTEMLDYGALILSEPEELLAALPQPQDFEPQDAPF